MAKKCMNECYNSIGDIMKKLLIPMIFTIYLIISFSFIDSYPFIHSDETWLAGISKQMIETEKLVVTEPFFDLYLKYPHALKIIFNLIQSGFIYLFGFHIFSVRLVSLLSMLIGAYFFFLYVKKEKGQQSGIITLLIMLSMIQFIYSSHFARQESILFMLFAIGLYLYSKYENPYLNALPIIFSIGIHPNSFVIFLPILSLYLVDKEYMKGLKLILIVGIGACFYIGSSFLMDSNFIYNYLNFGETLGVKMTLLEKFKAIYPFYQKLYYGVSGTYYTPDLKYFFAIALITLLYSLKDIRDNFTIKQYVSLLSLNIGTILIGRFNQTSLILLIIPIIVLIGTSIGQIRKNNTRYIISTFVIGVVSINSILNINMHIKEDYNYYINEISEVVPNHSIVLGNLNALMANQSYQFYDYRNLEFLDENNLTFENYVYQRNIEYIIYPEEMDFIYERRPTWNGIYGNLYPYYEDMKNFIDYECILIKEFDSYYGMRIVRYMTKPYSIKIYKIRD
jgi:hypothetical protein